MSKVQLNVACGWYDRILPLLDGSVETEGLDINMLIMQPEQLFWRMLQYEEFDASEMSLGAFLIMAGRNEGRFIGIPVFPSRMFRLSTIFIRDDGQIKHPGDLRGCKIGTPDYTMTAGMWQRGFFADKYDIKPSDVKWYYGGLNEPGRKQRIDFTPPQNVSLEYIGEEKTLDEMLKTGEIDAIFTSRNIKSFNEGNNHITRLWQDYQTEEKAYYKETGIFPIMHLFVIKRDIYEKNPWIAVSLYKAFEEAKKICMNRMFSSTALTYSIPWLLPELKNIEDLMGRDFWPYGVEKNEATLNTACRYAYEQGLSRQLLKPEDLFAPSTIEMFKI